MAYTHLTMKELSWIETYYDTGLKPYKIAQKIGRSNQPVYNVVTFLKEGGTVIEYFDQYKQNKSKSGAKKKTFTRKQTQYNTLKTKFQRAGPQMSSLVELKKISVVRCEHSTDVLKKVLYLM